MDLSRYQHDPAAFQRDIHLDTGSGPRRFGEIMADFQAERFTAINPSLVAVVKHERPPVPRAWDERTKGASKDSDQAVNLLWLLAFSRRSLRIQIGAYDQQQADEIRLIVKAILRTAAPLNRFLASVIDVQTDKIINRRTDSVCEILTTDKLGSHGSRPDVVLINELTHQSDKGFAETLLDNLDKMPGGLGIIATNSGFDPSWQLEWKRTFQASSRWLVLEYSQPSPWIDQEALKESERRNGRGRYLRLWWGVWGSDTGDALDSTDIENCITQVEPMSGDEKGYAFVGGVDIGIRKHATGFVIIGKHVGWSEDIAKPKRTLTRTQRAMIELDLWDEPEAEAESIYHEATNRLRLAHVRAWQPKPGKRVSLEAVRTEILKAHERYNLAGVALDPHQGEHLIELLEKENVPVLRAVQTSNSLQEQATSVIECFQERQIELFHNADLLSDLKSLKIKDSGLKIRLVSPEKKGDGDGTGHGDLASALSFAVSLAKSSQISLAIRNVNRNIIAV